jgi:anti-sigma factor RsiW
MRDRHVTRLLTRYAHGQLSPAQRARVINHVRNCDHCRMVLAREERLAADLRREMPLIGQLRPGQLAHVWVGVWQEIGTPPRQPRTRSGGSIWLPGLGIALTMLLVLIIAVPLVAQNEVRAEAAPRQALPILSTASPTPGMTDEAPPRAGVNEIRPQATVALMVEVGASPAPMPEATISPEARIGSAYRP